MLRIDVNIFSYPGKYELFQEFSKYLYYKKKDSTCPLLMFSKEDLDAPLSFSGEVIPGAFVLVENEKLMLGDKIFPLNKVYLFDTRFNFPLREWFKRGDNRKILEEKVELFYKIWASFFPNIPFLKEFKESADEEIIFSLKGKGEGLTPSGTDFFIAYFWILSKLKEIPYNLTLEDENIFSQHLYFLWQQNLLPFFIHGFLHHLFSNQKIEKSLLWIHWREAKKFGNTTGISFLEGIIWGIKRVCGF